MEPVSPPSIPEISPNPTAQPVQLTPQDQRSRQMNKYLQTAGLVLQKILSGISKAVEDVVGLILRR